MNTNKVCPLYHKSVKLHLNFIHGLFEKYASVTAHYLHILLYILGLTGVGINKYETACSVCGKVIHSLFYLCS